jgi:predicted DNA-binding transcriptional regulator AlpA
MPSTQPGSERELIMEWTSAVELPRNRLWSVHEVSHYLGVSVHTLYYWRSCGQGPKCAVAGRHLRYRPTDVDSWFDAEAAKGVL